MTRLPHEYIFGTAAPVRVSPESYAFLIQLIFQPQVIRYHGDKFGIRRLAAVVLYGVAEI